MARIKWTGEVFDVAEGTDGTKLMMTVVGVGG